MKNNLSSKKCLPCSGQTPKLSLNDANNLLKELKSWNLSSDNSWLFKEFKFTNFKEALNFVNKIGEVAEGENHHPNIDFTWGYVKVSIQTHKVSGLTENDFILAAKIDAI